MDNLKNLQLQKNSLDGSTQAENPDLLSTTTQNLKKNASTSISKSTSQDSNLPSKSSKITENTSLETIKEASFRIKDQGFLSFKG